jgi:hypothetical protein
MTKRGTIAIGLPLFAIVILIWFQEHRATRLEQQMTTLQSQIAESEKVQQDNNRLQEQLKSVTDETDRLNGELARLRSERMVIQKQNVALKAADQPPSTPSWPTDPTSVPKTQPYHYTPDQSAYFTERLDFGKRIGEALRELAKDGNGQLPTNLTGVAKWLSTNNLPVAGDTGPLFGVGVRSFELIYSGNLNGLANPEQVILAREVNPVQINAELWTRMYVFGDGSVQRLEATRADGFTDREKQVWPGQP